MGGSGTANMGSGADATATDAAATGADATDDAASAMDALPLDGAGGGQDAPAAADAGQWLVWNALKNPILQVNGWSTKDVAVTYAGGVYYFYYSAFYSDNGQERSHVAMSSSVDLKTFAPARILFDGMNAGWIGMCSPDLDVINGQHVMTFNSWGDLAGKPNQLFYSTSADLVTWSPMKPLAANLTAGDRSIDATTTTANGRVYLFWKDGAGNPRAAAAPSLDGPWSFAGNGSPTLLMRGSGDNGRTRITRCSRWTDTFACSRPITLRSSHSFTK